MYKIKKYSYDQAKPLGVEIRPSKNPEKKIDVYKNGVYITSIGQIGFKDYPYYLEIDKQIAEVKRSAYHARHKKYSKIVGSPSYYASRILW